MEIRRERPREIVRERIEQERTRDQVKLREGEREGEREGHRPACAVQLVESHLPLLCSKHHPYLMKALQSPRKQRCWELCSITSL